MKIIRIFLILVILGSFINCSSDDDLGIIGKKVTFQAGNEQVIKITGNVIDYKKNKFIKMTFDDDDDDSYKNYYTYVYFNLKNYGIYTIKPIIDSNRINKEKKK